MSYPALSWQGMVIGDPLYTPYKHFESNSGVVEEADKPFRATAAAWKLWQTDHKLRVVKLRTAGAKKKEGLYYEILGLWYHYIKNDDVALSFMNSAANLYLSSTNKIRTRLHQVEFLRQARSKQAAVNILKETLTVMPENPYIGSVKSLLSVLDPPAPTPKTIVPSHTKP